MSCPAGLRHVAFTSPSSSWMPLARQLPDPPSYLVGRGLASHDRCRRRKLASNGRRPCHGVAPHRRVWRSGCVRTHWPRPPPSPVGRAAPAIGRGSDCGHQAVRSSRGSGGPWRSVARAHRGAGPAFVGKVWRSTRRALNCPASRGCPSATHGGITTGPLHLTVAHLRDLGNGPIRHRARLSGASTGNRRRHGNCLGQPVTLRKGYWGSEGGRPRLIDKVVR